MKKKIISILPFVIMLIWIPLYRVLDSLLLVEIFGCGCVPSAQTNILNIPYNANDLRFTVFFVLTLVLVVWSIFIAKMFQNKYFKIMYCMAVILFNGLLTTWVVKIFMWE